MRRLFQTFYKSAEGAISVLFAIMLPILIGFIALATDVGVWYIDQRNMQAAADMAALSSARQIGSIDSAAMLSLAKAESARNGFSEAGGVTIDSDLPPTSGAYSGNNNAVEIRLSKEQQRFFSVLALNNDPTTNARAVALKSSASNACILALDNDDNDAIRFSGSVDLSLDGCVIAANSSSERALRISGNVDISAESLHLVGNYETNGNSYTLDLDQPAVTYGSAVDDPYADLADPTYGSCTKSNYKASGTVTINPGVYCNNLTFNNNSNVTMNPGTYYISGGNFSINGNTTVTGNGVTIVLTGSGSNIANISINGTANINWTAPTSGAYAGILIYQDRDASESSGSNTINGNSTNSMKGTIYMPKQEISFSGNSSNSSGCLRLVARKITFTGNANFAHNCSAAGGDNVTVEQTVTLVE